MPAESAPTALCFLQHRPAPTWQFKSVSILCRYWCSRPKNRGKRCKLGWPSRLSGFSNDTQNNQGSVHILGFHDLAFRLPCRNRRRREHALR
jgi:hypothetical protein